MLLEHIDEMPSHIAASARLLGLDVGEKTVGLALSDLSRMIATPMETIRRSKFSKDVELLRSIINEHEVAGLVIGYPVNMDGSQGPRCQSIRQFAKNVAAKIDLPIVLWDERMSTMAVERTLLAADMSRKRRAEVVDKMAASYILQGAMDYLRGKE